MNWLELLGFGPIIDFEKEDEGMEKEEIIERLVAFRNGWENPKSATPDFWEEVIEAVKVGDDAISRQVALDACNQSINLFEAADRIRELPPVKQEPCADAISRKDALFAVRVGILSTATVYGRSEEGMATRREIEGALKALPPVNPAEKVGQWIPVSERLPELNRPLLVTAYHRVYYGHLISESGNYGYPIFRIHGLGDKNRNWVQETISHEPYSLGRIDAWMYFDIPEPYKASPTVAESEDKK